MVAVKKLSSITEACLSFRCLLVRNRNHTDVRMQVVGCVKPDDARAEYVIVVVA